MTPSPHRSPRDPRARLRLPTILLVVAVAAGLVGIGYGFLARAGTEALVASPIATTSATDPISSPSEPSAAATPTIEPTPTPTPTPGPTLAASAEPSPTPPQPGPGKVVVDRNVPFTPTVECGDGGEHEPCRLRLDVWRGDRVSGAPVVVTLHGRPRTRADMEPIDRLLAARGAVVFNADYRGSDEVERGYPMSFEDVACAVRFARAHARRYGGDPSRIVLVGHSFGTYVGSIVSLDGDQYHGACVVKSGSAEPDAFVGLSGSYHWHETPIWDTFFGADRDDVPGRWADGDPHTHLGGNKGSAWRFVTERTDAILDPDSSLEFHRALKARGYDTRLQTLDGSGHFTILHLSGDARTAAKVIESVAGLGGGR
ncbi:MAG: alpha/beta hydrolase [Chloroflexota bacterium]